MTALWIIFRKLAPLALALGVMLTLDSCSSSGSSSRGIPKNLPNIALSASSATPPHNMPTYSYPFDSRGYYVSDWAAEGEKKAGRAAAASNDDVSKWQGSHGGSASKSKPKLVSTTTNRKPTSSSSDSPTSKTKSSTTASTKPATKSGSTASKKPSAKSGSVTYTVKSGDTLYGIALKYKSTVAKIKAANGMSSDKLAIGKVLRVPR
jgi:LysM repeat protein